MELTLGVEVELALALTPSPEAALAVGLTSLTSVCMSDWIWVSSPSESNVASWVTNWLGSTGFIGLWFSSCTDNNCRNVWVKSTPGALDEDEDEEVADEEEDVAGLEAAWAAGWSICSSDVCTSFALLNENADAILRRPREQV